MAIELHHLHPSHDDEVARLKERIAELESLNHDLCERVTENDEIRLHWEEIEQTRTENERMKARIAELKEERRWRKFPDEKPKWGEEVLVLDKEGEEIDLKQTYDDEVDFATEIATELVGQNEDFETGFTQTDDIELSESNALMDEFSFDADDEDDEF